MGGCVASKQKSNPYERIADYQKESDAYLKNLSVEPRYLMTENYRDGYISPDLFYNWIHAGFCGPYISNPYYMILIDFRSLEDYMQSHISTAIHHSHFQWDSSHIVQDLEKYSLVVFYDFDGTSTANVKSPETKAIRSLKDKKIEIFCIVGGLRSVCAKFPHLIEQSRFLNHAVTSPPPSRKSREERGRLSWMPCLVYEDRVFLGSYEQADDEKVLRSLDITHVLSIGRSPESVLKFEAMVQEGLGENGAGVYLQGAEREMIEDQLKKYAFNKLASDRISLKRNLPDVRHHTCKEIDYDEQLPSASVVLIFNNEALSALLRTVWSVLRYSPAKYLHEIILLDDASNSTEITEVLPLYLKHRLPSKVKLFREKTQQGLIGARLAGAKHVTGDVMIFLDSHCEATIGWLEPLLQRIKDKPTNIVIPAIDSISDKTIEFNGHPGGIGISVGGFTWSGHFTWESFHFKPGRRACDPAPTPTMAGGLFAVDKDFFWRIGGYDPGMIGWGGENLELSFRVWRCGGSMENLPCSHVGHIFRASHPYFIPEDSHGKNTARMAEVWMDDYKRFFYLYRTDLRDKDKKVFGDLSERKAIKDKLKCKSFKWYLENIIPHKYVMDEQSQMYGRIRNRHHKDLCIDHLQRDMAHKLTPYVLGQYPCHAFMGSSQYYTLSKTGQFRNEYMCGQAGSGNKVRMVGCGENESLKWIYTESGRLQHVDTGNCLTPETAVAGAEVLLIPCNEEDKSQVWDFEFKN